MRSKKLVSRNFYFLLVISVGMLCLRVPSRMASMWFTSIEFPKHVANKNITDKISFDLQAIM